MPKLVQKCGFIKAGGGGRYRKFKDIVRLADILGHSSIDTTRIYTMHSGKEERRQLGQLRLIL